jgi:hypothetical protein
LIIYDAVDIIFYVMSVNFLIIASLGPLRSNFYLRFTNINLSKKYIAKM